VMLLKGETGFNPMRRTYRFQAQAAEGGLR
jgi:hypothetical protein